MDYPETLGFTLVKAIFVRKYQNSVEKLAFYLWYNYYLTI